MTTTTRHVIIADDEPAVRGLLARVVARTFPAVTISAVADGQAALDVFRRHGADLILTNQAMPYVDGLALIRVVRAHNPAVPIVMVSATAATEPAARAVGASAFVLKPFTVAELAQVLRALLTP